MYYYIPSSPGGGTKQNAFYEGLEEKTRGNKLLHNTVVGNFNQTTLEEPMMGKFGLGAQLSSAANSKRVGVHKNHPTMELRKYEVAPYDSR